MHQRRARVPARLWLLAAVAGVVAVAGVLPWFGSAAYAAGPFPNLDASVALW